MEDTEYCLVCESKLYNNFSARSLRSLPEKKYLDQKKICNFRSSKKQDHRFIIYYKDKKIIRLLLGFVKNEQQYIVVINFQNNTSEIYLPEKYSMADDATYYGDEALMMIPKCLEPDFPDLLNFKEKISKYLLFS